jgi:hypothetical protein
MESIVPFRCRGITHARISRVRAEWQEIRRYLKRDDRLAPVGLANADEHDVFVELDNSKQGRRRERADAAKKAGPDVALMKKRRAMVERARRAGRK